MNCKECGITKREDGPKWHPYGLCSDSCIKYYLASGKFVLDTYMHRYGENKDTKTP